MLLSPRIALSGWSRRSWHGTSRQSRNGCLQLLLKLLQRQQLLELAFGLLLGQPVLLLQEPQQLFPLTGDLIQLVVGQLAPFLLHFAFELFPASLKAIPV